MVALEEEKRQELKRLLRDCLHQATARNLNEEQVAWLRRMLREGLKLTAVPIGGDKTEEKGGS